MNFSIPKFNKDIPIISPAAGTEVAYKDPNSPESLMKKVATLDAQAKVDSMYDAKIETHSDKKVKESYVDFRFFKQSFRKNNVQSLLLLLFTSLLFLSLVTMKSLRKNAKIYLLLLIIALFTYSIILYQK